MDNDQFPPIEGNKTIAEDFAVIASTLFAIGMIVFALIL